ncbi:MAG TPA: class II aldolase/adducin family protein [Stellaceae bacterium]|jgi:L-fuculose-phosphate aldolase|nr:class II aldolase/adducin family protein [Stellaceae bacterium]
MTTQLTPEEAKKKLIVSGRILAMHGHGDMTRGHLSVRVPGNPELFFMKAHSLGLDEITMDNILTIDLDGKVVAGTARRHSEVFIHSEIFRARPDVEAVIHTHSVHTIALSAITTQIRPLCQGGAMFVDALPVYTDTIDLIRRTDQGQGVAKALGPHKAVLMRHHGVAMTGRSLDEAVVLLFMLENAAEVQLKAMAAGSLTSEFPPEDIQELKRKISEPDQFTVNYNYLARLAAKAYGEV